jgi:hypothetical protein
MRKIVKRAAAFPRLIGILVLGLVAPVYWYNTSGHDSATEKKTLLPTTMSRSPRVVPTRQDLQTLAWPSDIWGIPAKPALERQGWPATKAIDMVDLMNKLQQQSGVSLSYFLVNIGAGDGCIEAYKYECDPVNVLLASNISSSSPPTSPWRGLLVEPNPGEAVVLRRMYPNGVTVLEQGINSSSIFDRLSSCPELPFDFDVFKMDTDSADCDVLDALLSRGLYRPKVILSEFNILYPPPIRYNLVDDGRWKFAAHNSKLIDQCSISHLVDRMEFHDYVLFQLDGWDAWFVRRDIADAHLHLPAYYDTLSWYLAGYAGIGYMAQFINLTLYGAPYTNGLSLPCLQWTKRVRKAAARQNRTLTTDEVDHMLRDLSEVVPRVMQQENNTQQYRLSRFKLDQNTICQQQS